jgi:hypothetical protein
LLLVAAVAEVDTVSPVKDLELLVDQEAAVPIAVLLRRPLPLEMVFQV